MVDNIDDVDAFREKYSRVHIEGMGEREILTVDSGGLLHVGNENRPDTVHIDEDHVTLLE